MGQSPHGAPQSTRGKVRQDGQGVLLVAARQPPAVVREPVRLNAPLDLAQRGQAGEVHDLLSGQLSIIVIQRLDEGDHAVGHHAQRGEHHHHLTLGPQHSHTAAQASDPGLDVVVETSQSAGSGGQALTALHPGDELIDPGGLLGQAALLRLNRAPRGPQIAQHRLATRVLIGADRVRGEHLSHLGQRQSAVGQPPDTQQTGHVFDAVLAPPPHRGRNLQQTQVVVVAHRPRRGTGDPGELLDVHESISAGDVTSPSSPRWQQPDRSA